MNDATFRSSYPRLRAKTLLCGWVAAALTAAIASAAPPGGGSPPPPPIPNAASSAVPLGQSQASAKELTDTMRRAVGLIAKTLSAKASEPAFRSAKARAFVRALAGVSSQVESLGKSVQAADAKTFDAMTRTGSALAALQVTFRYNGIEDDDVEDGFEKLAAIYNVFRRNYGRDLIAARTEGESALSPGQRSARDDLQRHGQSLAKSLGALQPTLKDNPAQAFEVAAILKGLGRLNRPPRDRRGLLDQLATAELLLGRRDGLEIYLGEVFKEELKKLDPAQESFRVYREAFARTLAAVLADEKPAEVFARAATYVEDLGVAGVNETELPGLLEALKTSPGNGGDAAAVKADPGAARAADAQINADDPDDDTSLDATGAEGDPASPDSGND